MIGARFMQFRRQMCIRTARITARPREGNGARAVGLLHGHVDQERRREPQRRSRLHHAFPSSFEHLVRVVEDDPRIGVRCSDEKRCFVLEVVGRVDLYGQIEPTRRAGRIGTALLIYGCKNRVNSRARRVLQAWHRDVLIRRHKKQGKQSHQ